MNKTSYEQFIDNYACEMSHAIRQFEALDADAIMDNNEDLAQTLCDIDNIYDRGMSDYFERALCGTETLCIISLATRAASNMNRYGTEMREALNALEDFNSALRKYLPEDDNDDFSEEDMKKAFE